MLLWRARGQSRSLRETFGIAGQFRRSQVPDV